MAQNPRLQVEIGADISDIQRSLDTVTGALEDLQREAGDTKGLDELETALNDIKDATKTVQTDLVETGKTTKELASGLSLAGTTSKELAGGLGEVASQAGGAAGAAGALLTSFSSGGLAGLAVAGLALIVDQWENIKLLIGETGAVLRELQRIGESGIGVRDATIAAARAQTEFLEVAGATQEQINASKFEELRLTEDLIARQQTLARNLRRQINELEQGGLDGIVSNDELVKLNELRQEFTTVVTQIRTAATDAERLKQELGALDGVTVTANVVVKVSTRTPQQQVETDTRGISAEIENIGAGVAGQIIAPSAEEINQGIADLQSARQPLADAYLDLANIASQGISALAQSVGSALAGGREGIAQAGQLLLGTLGGIISDIGQTLIATGTQKLIAEKLLPIFGGGAGLIAAGAALVAIGSGISGRAGGGGGGVGAGFSTGGTAGVASGGGIPQTSARTPSFGASGPQRVVFVISGTNLVGVLNNTLDANQRLQNPIIV